MLIFFFTETTIPRSPAKPNLKCTSRSQRDYWCVFSESEPTGLPAKFVMEYSLEDGSPDLVK